MLGTVCHSAVRAKLTTARCTRINTHAHTHTRIDTQRQKDDNGCVSWCISWTGIARTATAACRTRFQELRLCTCIVYIMYCCTPRPGNVTSQRAFYLTLNSIVTVRSSRNVQSSAHLLCAPVAMLREHLAVGCRECHCIWGGKLKL